MNVNVFNKIIFIFFTWNASINCAIPSIPSHITITIKQINELMQELSVVFSLTKKDFIYKDFITFSVAHPSVRVSPWKTDSTSVLYYDPLFKGTKEIFKKNITITL